MIKKVIFFLFLLTFFSCKEEIVRKKDPSLKGAFSIFLIKKDPVNPNETKQKIIKINKEIKENRLKFEEAIPNSDNDQLSKERGGFIGVQRFGFFPIPLSEREEEEIFSLKVGEISKVIELPNHFAFFKREELFEDKAINHILISYKGAMLCPIGIQRTKEQALKLAEEALKDLRDGISWSIVARKYSNGLEAKRGGYLGYLSPKALFPNHSKVVLKMNFGDISPVLESPIGFHIYQITKPWPDTIGLKHIMVAYQGAIMAPFTITRSKEEAKELAGELRKKILAGEQFEKIAKKYSDDKSTAKTGGDLGIICLDKFIPTELEEIAFNLEINQISDVVESPGGYHILLRYK